MKNLAKFFESQEVSYYLPTCIINVCEAEGAHLVQCACNATIWPSGLLETHIL